MVVVTKKVSSPTVELSSEINSLRACIFTSVYSVQHEDLNHGIRAVNMPRWIHERKWEGDNMCKTRRLNPVLLRDRITRSEAVRIKSVGMAQLLIATMSHCEQRR